MTSLCPTVGSIAFDESLWTRFQKSQLGNPNGNSCLRSSGEREWIFGEGSRYGKLIVLDRPGKKIKTENLEGGHLSRGYYG